MVGEAIERNRDQAVNILKYLTVSEALSCGQE